MMFRLVLATAVALPISAFAQNTAYDGDFIGRLNQTLVTEGLSDVTVSGTGSGEKHATMSASDTEDDIQQSLRVIGRVGEMIANSQCAQDGRPSSITYSLTASFHIVVGVETGTEVTWELDGLCERMGL